MISWQKLGPHRFYRDRDVLFVELRGDFTRNEVQELWSVVIEIEQEHGHVFRIYDAREGGKMTPEARQYINDRKRVHVPKGPDVIAGANFAVRTIVELIQRAGRLLRIKQAPVFFLASLDDLPELLRVQRELLAAKASLTKSIPPSERAP